MPWTEIRRSYPVGFRLCQSWFPYRGGKGVEQTQVSWSRLASLKSSVWKAHTQARRGPAGNIYPPGHIRSRHCDLPIMIERVLPVYLQQCFPPEMYLTAADHRMPTSSTASRGLHILYIDYKFLRSIKSQSFCCMLGKIQQARHADGRTSAEGRRTLVQSHCNSISGHDDPFFWSARRSTTRHLCSSI